MMEFYWPWALLLLLLLPILAILNYMRKATATVQFSNIDSLTGCGRSWRILLRPVLPILRYLCLALLIIALARPRQGTEIREVVTEGVAIQMVIDRSSSMSEQMRFGGGQMNRLEVVKRVADEFIRGNKDDLKGRPGDLIGLISFAKYADTLCPLVHGHEVLSGFLKETQLVKGRTSEDGTAIGAALQLAAARLQTAEQQILDNTARMRQLSDDERESKPPFTIKSKIIILLTDGQETVRQVDPRQAARLAKEWGIKIYTIGIGSPQTGFFSTNVLDERLLNSIASETGGFYGRATNDRTLRQIYAKIDELEETKIVSLQYTDYAEKFAPFALAAMILLITEIILSCTIFRKIP